MIVGICGLIGSGKGTVADILEKEQGWIKISFADSLKDCVSTIFGWPRHLLEGDTSESREWREKVDPWWAHRLSMPHLTPRFVLQYWGTEVIRQGFHNDMWILSLERKIIDASTACAENHKTAHIVIPDTRFPNEMQMIRRLGGQIWTVQRGENPEWFQLYQSHSIIPHDIHSSEWSWARETVDHIIENNSTIQDLRSTVDKLTKLT